MVSPTRANNGFGEHKEVGGLYRSISQSGERRLGRFGNNRSNPSLRSSQLPAANHHRVASEVTVPSPTVLTMQGPVRAASAMEHGFSRSIDNVLQNKSPSSTSPKVGIVSSQKSAISSGSLSSKQSPLAAVQEDEHATSRAPQPPRGLGILNSTSMESLNSRRSTIDSLDPSVRSSSQASARELKEQVNDLKSRIANLRVQAKVDSLRRKSLQNLRQPSPFTAAEGWDEAEAERRSSSSPVQRLQSPNPSLRHKSGTVEKSIEETGRQRSSTIIQHTPQKSRLEIKEETPDFKTPNHMYDGTPIRKALAPAESNYEDAASVIEDENGEIVRVSEAERIYLNEALEESLHSGETMGPVAEDDEGRDTGRHEDRPDAFDYEHFILHSALGSYSRRSQSDETSSGSSYCSSDSVQTAREIDDDQSIDEVEEQEILRSEADEPTPKPRQSLRLSSSMRLRPKVHSHFRNDSVDSISTMQSFATATEGKRSRDSGSGSSKSSNGDSVPHEILNWNGGHQNVSTPSRSSSVRSPQGTLHTVRPGGLPTPPTMSPRESVSNNHMGPQSPNGPVTLESLVTSLVSFSGRNGNAFERHLPPLTARLESTDKELMQGLLEALGVFCTNVAEANRSPSKYERKLWRRRLDAARMVLNGELDVEPA